MTTAISSRSAGGGPREIEGEIRRLREFAACGSRFDALEPASAEAWLEGDVGQVRPPRRADQQCRAIIRPLSFAEGDESALDELWAVNVKAPFRLIRLALPHLAKSGHGRIINVASTDAKRYRDAIGLDRLRRHQACGARAFARGEVRRLGARRAGDGALPGRRRHRLHCRTSRRDAAGRIAPTTIAEMAAFLLRLPNNASVAELVVNSRLEPTL